MRTPCMEADAPPANASAGLFYLGQPGCDMGLCCRELSGAVGSCWELLGAVGSCWELLGAAGGCGELKGA
eukprot:12390394-Alexandrium_andersonii.AAC.1